MTLTGYVSKVVLSFKNMSKATCSLVKTQKNKLNCQKDDLPLYALTPHI